MARPPAAGSPRFLLKTAKEPEKYRLELHFVKENFHKGRDNYLTTEIKFMDNQKGFAPIIIVLIVVVLLAGGILAWQYWWVPKEIEEKKVSFEQLSTCNVDSDCIFVSHKSCGGTIKISINKKYESQYNSTPEFQDSTGEICQTLGISYDEQKQIVEGQVPTESLCISNKCIPKYLGDETANWKTYYETKAYLIKYPSDWKSPEKYILSLGIRTDFRKNEDFLISIYMGTYYNQDWGRNYTFAEWVSKQKNWVRDILKTNTKEENIILDNLPATKLSYENSFRRTINYEIYVEKEASVFCEISTEINSSKQDIYIPIFNQMLSTFRFLE